MRRQHISLFAILIGIVLISGCVSIPVQKNITNITNTSNVSSMTSTLQEKIGFCDGFSADQGIDNDIQDAKSMGMGIGRPLGNVFSQDTIESSKGVYDFSKPDSVVKKMQDGGINIFGTIFPTGIPKIPQSSVDLQRFGDYVKAVVDRYNGDGKNDMPGLETKIIYWQVGIEPFCDSSADTSTCYKNFFDLVKTAYQSAKSVDSSLMIAPGGAGPIYSSNGQLDTGAISGIYKYFFDHSGVNYMDFFNFHYLVGSKGTDIKQYVDYWKQYTGGKEIWLSETGTRDVRDRMTISSNADEEALWAKQHIETAFANGVTKLFWCRAEHSFTDMPKVVETLQNFAKQYGGTPVGSPIKRSQTQQGTQQNIQPSGTTQQPGGQQTPTGGSGGYCGDNICQDIERTTGGCPTDCR